MMSIERAIAYFADAIRKTDDIMPECSPALQARLTEQREHFVVALGALEAQRWIPVTERLPEPNAYILAYSPAYRNEAALTHTSRGYMARLPKSDITHWMECPAPPKGED